MRIICLGCKQVTEKHRSGRCTACRLGQQRAKDATPNRRAQKAKYNTAHRKQRAHLAPLVARGEVRCWRCRGYINGEWHLGHRPGLPSAPEHRECNEAHSNEHKRTE